MNPIRTAAALATVLVPCVTAQQTGPSSSQSPYLLPAAGAAGVKTVSLITVGDSVGGYRMCGIPDGIGLYKRGTESRLFGMVMNHEFGATAGITRSHGSAGSFVSLWGIDPTTKTVFVGRDQVQALVTTGPAAAGRFCSGDLAERIAFWPTATAVSLEPFIYLNGEEIGNEGRAFAHVVTGSDAGIGYDVPALGKASWENLVARPYASTKTVVIGMDDSTPGQVYVYVGDKLQTGTVPQRAGLSAGTLYGVKIPGVPLEDRTTGVGAASTHFDLHSFGDVSGWSGGLLQTSSVAAGVTEFLRPEDGAFDVQNPADFYFVTTDRFNTATTVGRSRLWRLHFDNVDDVTVGGTITMLLDGTEGGQMYDNMCLDRRGHVILQEDVGNNAHLGKVWQYDIATDSLTVLLEHDPARFLSGGANFLTQDEESSGVVDATRFLGPGWFICDVQAHFTNPDPELVEGGQVVAFFNPASL